MGASHDVDQLVARLDHQRPAADDPRGVARWVLRALSLPHAPVYMAAEVRDALATLGLTHPRVAYFAQRAAPLGPVPAEVVIATFYGFAPRVVKTAIPGAWSVTSPEAVLAATLDAMGVLLRRIVPSHAQIERAADLLRPIAELHPVVGRPLAAAWASVPWTGDAHVDLWLATTIIRESRGDGHIAALVTHGIGPLASHLLQDGDEAARRPKLTSNRGWTESEIDATVAEMQQCELLDASGVLTAHARELRARIEDVTDETSSTAWAATPADVVEEVCDLAVAIARPIIASGTLPPRALERLTEPLTR